MEKKREELRIKLNKTHFITSIVTITELVKETSVKHIERTGKTSKNHVFLQKMCNSTLSYYKSDGDNNKKFDESKIIKKIYRTLRDNMELLLNNNDDLFNIKDSTTNKLITIIPGVDVGLVYSKLSDRSKTELWKSFYLLYISTVNMVHTVNTVKGERKIKIDECTTELKKRLAEKGMNVRGMLFNPFIGIEGSDEFGITELYTQGPMENKSDNGGTAGIENIAKLVGFDIEKVTQNLSDQLKDITDEQIGEVTEKIKGIMGAEGDDEVSDVCGSLIKGVLSDIKSNGMTDLRQTAKNTMERMENDIENNMTKEKMEKTAGKMMGFMKKSYKKLGKMKDAKGNNIGSLLSGALKTYMNSETLKEYGLDMEDELSGGSDEDEDEDEDKDQNKDKD